MQKGDPVSRYVLRGQHWENYIRLSKVVTYKGRAIAISVSERSAVGRSVRPADHVDVIHLYRDPKTKKMHARLLLQNIIVLATGRQMPAAREQRPSRYRTVTLLVLPTEAVILTFAQSQGSLHLTLRNPEDASVAQPPPDATLKTITAARLKKLLQKRNRTIQKIKIRTPDLGQSSEDGVDGLESA